MGRFRKSRRRGGSTITHKEIAEKETRLKEVKKRLNDLLAGTGPAAKDEHLNENERITKTEYEEEIKELENWFESFDYTNIEPMPKGFNPKLDQKHEAAEKARQISRDGVRAYLRAEEKKIGAPVASPAQPPVTAPPENKATQKSRLPRLGALFRLSGGGKRTRRRRKTKRSGGRKRKSRAKRRRTRR